MELPILLFKTIVLRPYVFVFLAVFLLAGTITMGRRRTLVFLLTTWLIAFLSEFLSTRIGFPYGLYHYTQNTRGQELFIFNVPFMDSLSYTFLLYAAFSASLFSLAPIRRKGLSIQVVDSFSLRGGWRVLLLTAVYMMMIDVVIDPITLHGDRWFLGKIYHYEHEGHYFGVPLSNAFGWGFVGLSALFVYQKIEKHWLGEFFKDKGMRVWPIRGMMGIGLYLGVLVFILCVGIWIREWPLVIAGVFIFLLPVTLIFLRLFDPRCQATEEEWLIHLRSFQIDLG